MAITNILTTAHLISQFITKIQSLDMIVSKATEIAERVAIYLENLDTKKEKQNA